MTRSSEGVGIRYLLSASNCSAAGLPSSLVFLLFKLIKPFVLVLVLVGVYVLAPAIGDVNGETLQRSVAGGLDAKPDVDVCRRRGSVTWRCTVTAGPNDDPAQYSVRVRDGHCWTARRTSRAGSGRSLSGGVTPPARAGGCAHLRDQAYALVGIG